jgi:hypothetical protein
LESLTPARPFHHIDGFGVDPCHKALNTRVSQQGLYRVELFADAPPNPPNLTHLSGLKYALPLINREHL